MKTVGLSQRELLDFFKREFSLQYNEQLGKLDLDSPMRSEDFVGMVVGAAGLAAGVAMSKAIEVNNLRVAYDLKKLGLSGIE